MTHIDPEWMADVRAAAAAATSLTAPVSVWSDINARLDRGDIVVLPSPDRAIGGRSRVAAIAAGLLLCTSVVAALVPQTGVRAWIERQLRSGEDITAPAAAPDALPAPAELALSPVNGVLHVELTNVSSPLQLRVRLTNESELAVRATGGAAAARFIVGAGRIDIEGAAGGEIVLGMPRGARVITVDVAGVRAVEYRADRLSVFAPGADTVGAELILPVR